ncbi:unnamed protein product [Bemisia tabaci]|uniref:Uncharacterized protein n=1 Tax=Bemisia tabaci TaxID=7038 RepID=A0A9P0APT7_BEMTA|nr:unnamed protein product [Bemisia tabaci]
MTESSTVQSSNRSSTPLATRSSTGARGAISRSSRQQRISSSGSSTKIEDPEEARDNPTPKGNLGQYSASSPRGSYSEALSPRNSRESSPTGDVVEESSHVASRLSQAAGDPNILTQIPGLSSSATNTGADHLLSDDSSDGIFVNLQVSSDNHPVDGSPAPRQNESSRDATAPNVSPSPLPNSLFCILIAHHFSEGNDDFSEEVVPGEVVIPFGCLFQIRSKKMDSRSSRASGSRPLSPPPGLPAIPLRPAPPYLPPDLGLTPDFSRPPPGFAPLASAPGFRPAAPSSQVSLQPSPSSVRFIPIFLVPDGEGDWRVHQGPPFTSPAVPSAGRTVLPSVAVPTLAPSVAPFAVAQPPVYPSVASSAVAQPPVYPSVASSSVAQPPVFTPQLPLPPLPSPSAVSPFAVAPPVFACGWLTGLSPVGRVAYVQELGRCLNCLGDHPVVICQSPRDCLKCWALGMSARHHTLLHEGLGHPPVSDLAPFLAVPTPSEPCESRAVRKRACPAEAGEGAAPKVARAPCGRQGLRAAMEHHGRLRFPGSPRASEGSAPPAAEAEPVPEQFADAVPRAESPGVRPELPSPVRPISPPAALPSPSLHRAGML